MSEKTKKQISNSLKGHKFSDNSIKKMSETIKKGFKNGRNVWNKNKKLPQFSGRKHPNYKNGLPKCIDCGKQLNRYGSKRCRSCYAKSRKGKNSHFWKGGITSESKIIRTSVEYKIWRKAIFEKDNFTCQKCEQKGGDLVVHHINNFADFSELRFAIDNGIVLCKKCHIEFHKKYGRHNNTKEQLKEFLCVIKF